MDLGITETHQSESSIDLHRIKRITALSRNTTKWIRNSHDSQCLTAFLGALEADAFHMCIQVTDTGNVKSS